MGAGCRHASISRLQGHVDVLPVQSTHVVTEAATLRALDLTSMAPDDAYFTAEFELQATCPVRAAASVQAPCQGPRDAGGIQG